MPKQPSKKFLESFYSLRFLLIFSPTRKSSSKFLLRKCRLFLLFALLPVSKSLKCSSCQRKSARFVFLPITPKKLVLRQSRNAVISADLPGPIPLALLPLARFAEILIMLLLAAPAMSPCFVLLVSPLLILLFFLRLFLHPSKS